MCYFANFKTIYLYFHFVAHWITKQWLSSLLTGKNLTFNYFFFIQLHPRLSWVGCLSSTLFCLVSSIESPFISISFTPIHPFSFWSPPYAASNFHSYGVLRCFSIISSWHMLETPQSSFSHLFYNVLYIFWSPQFLTLSFLETPTIHRSIYISVLRIKSSSFLLYSIPLHTSALISLPFCISCFSIY